MKKQVLILDTVYGHFEIEKNIAQYYQSFKYGGDPIEVQPEVLISPKAVLRAELVTRDDEE